LGDLVIFSAALWLTLGVRYLSVPSYEVFWQHFLPFIPLFFVWVFMFFLAGLYGRYTRILRAHLSETILYAQTVNVGIAALFFFLIPYFGIAPKTILAIYLLISSGLIFAWRVYMFPILHLTRRARAVLIGTGSVIHELVEEVEADTRYPFSFETVIDTKEVGMHETIQQVVRASDGMSDITMIVADSSDKVINSALPIVYDLAFRKENFVFVDLGQLYQDVFDRVSLPLMHYNWVLGNLSSSPAYDIVKRTIDIFVGICMGVVSLLVYPFVALAIKLDDGGAIFITQERIGKFQKKIQIVKFRSMSGNDNGNYENGKTKLVVTRVGKVIRRLRIDELPQIWNIVRGDLSFVGPRPELPNLVNQYNSKIPYYDARHLITPGLTGWAQLKHDTHPHGGTEVDETKTKLSYDLFYLKNRSLFLDLYIMFQTARIVLFERGS